MRTLNQRLRRGSALMTAVMLISVMLVVTAGVLYYSSQERRRAIQSSRSIPRNYCVETGLQLARTYYGANYNRWNNFLAVPTQYDPVASSCNLTPADPTSAALQAARPELFADLDGDGALDVYIYMRDNFDEHAPAVTNCQRDNDLQVVVGAVCISRTLAPLREDGTVSPVRQTTEGILQYSPPTENYAQRCGSSTGNCNTN